MFENGGDPVVRRTLFSGHVQGVGFRYTATALAERFDVTGFVRNLPDGRVELVCEGAADETARFIETVRQSMSHFIRDVHTTEQPTTGIYSGFGIRF